MIEHESHYQLIRLRVTEAYRLAHEAQDEFLEHMLGMCLMETADRFKQIELEKPVKAKRRKSQPHLEII